jgi:hypothetical protein
MPFKGRGGFSKDVARAIAKFQTAPPSDVKSATAWVYSSVSGTGKTVSMLELKNTLKGHLPGTNTIVSYLGFNCQLDLTDEESLLMDVRGVVGAKRVLARRLLGATVMSHNNRDKKATLIPGRDLVYGKRSIPSEGECRDMLVREIGASPTSRVVIVACVDEIQLLNSRMVVGGTPLGRYFLRTLRRWQLEWWGLGLTIIPLGTGILLDFLADPTTGINKTVQGDDAVLVSYSDFGEIVRGVVEEQYESRFATPRPSKENVVALMSAVLWPRVRLVGWWRDRKEINSLRCL